MNPPTHRHDRPSRTTGEGVTHERPQRTSSVRPAGPRVSTAAAAVLAVLLASACTLSSNQLVGGRRGGDINSSRPELIPVDERAPAPQVGGATTDGGTLQLSDLAGTPVLVNFWASWCGPCAREVPELVRVAAQYRGEVELLGVDVRDSVVNARSFERDQGVTYPSLVDPDATIAASFGGVAPSALPSTILLDADQRVSLQLFGAVTQDQLEPYLDELVAEARAR